MPNRLTQLRESLRKNNADFLKSYNFEFKSLKLAIFDCNIKIISMSHPFYNFTNSGEYKGVIQSSTKPSDMSITFIEDDKFSVNKLFDFWDSLKYNRSTGIHYPKAAYEDIAYLRYIGSASSSEPNEILEAFNNSVAYTLSGFYPIQRDPIPLAYDTSDIVKVSVTFNVDSIDSVGVF